MDAQLCDQRWKETSDYCTVAWICDGFYCEGMPLRHSGSATESFSSQLSPSGVQIPWVSSQRLTESVSGIASEEEVLLVMMSCDKLQSGF